MLQKVINGVRAMVKRVAGAWRQRPVRNISSLITLSLFFCAPVFAEMSVSSALSTLANNHHIAQSFQLPTTSINVNNYGYTYAALWDAGTLTLHSGIDINTSDDCGRVVLASGKGVVRFVGNGGSTWGGIVLIQHRYWANGEFHEIASLYAHVAPLDTLAEGQLVNAGQAIAYIADSTTGTCSSFAGVLDPNSWKVTWSPHLHFEIRTKVDLVANAWTKQLMFQQLAPSGCTNILYDSLACRTSSVDAAGYTDPLIFVRDHASVPYPNLEFSPASYSELLRNGGQLNITATGWNPAPGTVSIYNGPNVEYVVPRQFYQANITVAPSNWIDNVISTSISVNLFTPSSLGNSATPFGAPAIDSNFIYPVNIMVYSGTLPFPLSPLLGQSYYPFRDVKPDNWASCYIMKLWRAGIVNGQNGLFRPTDYVSRAEFLKMTMNAAFTPSLFTSASINSFLPTYFTDNNFAVWQYPYINFALQKNIINDSFCNGSFTSHCFYPNDPITRSDAVKFLVRAFGLQQNGLPTTFSDTPVSSYPDVYVAASNYGDGGCGGDLQKIISGYGDGRFVPKDPITRDQAAKIIAVALSFKKP